jgi:hypothetical protein
MRYAVLVLMGLASISGSLGCQNAAAKSVGASPFQPKPLDDEWSRWLVGRWEVTRGRSDFVGGELEGLGESNAEGASGFTVELGLNGQFLIMESWAETGETSDEQMLHLDEQMQHLKEATNASDEDFERFLSMPFREMQIRTVDPKTGERIGYLFDSLRCIARGTGRLEGNREIMEWEWSGTGQGASSIGIIERTNDDAFTLHHKYILPDGRRYGRRNSHDSPDDADPIVDLNTDFPRRP